jgi:hypothetical protein
MNENSSYSFDAESGILFKRYFGNITIEIIKESWLKAFENNLIPDDVKGFILDYTQGTFDFPLQDFQKISAFYREHLDVFDGLRVGIVTHNPKDQIVPKLVAMEDQGYHSKEFSTMEAAVAWVLANPGLI